MNQYCYIKYKGREYPAIIREINTKLKRVRAELYYNEFYFMDDLFISKWFSQSKIVLNKIPKI